MNFYIYINLKKKLKGKLALDTELGALYANRIKICFRLRKGPQKKWATEARTMSWSENIRNTVWPFTNLI